MPTDVSDDIQPGSDVNPAAASSSDADPDDSAGSGAGTTDQPDDSDGQGPIPFKDHKRILEGTRREYEERFGWVEGLDRSTVDRALAVLEELDGNPQRVHAWLSDKLRGNGAEAPAPNLRTEDGRLLYDADQARKLVDFHVERALTTVNERLGGMESSLQQRAASDAARQELEEARTWPHFEAQLPAIIDTMKAAQRAKQPMTLERAYLITVLPKIGQLERHALTNELKQKPGPQDRLGGHRPAGVRVSDHDRSLSDLIVEEMTPRR